MSSRPAKPGLIRNPSERKKLNMNSQLQGEFPADASRLICLQIEVLSCFAKPMHQKQLSPKHNYALTGRTAEALGITSTILVVPLAIKYLL